MAVSFWAIIISVLVGLIGIGILAKYTGVGDVFAIIISLIKEFFAFIRSIFSYILQSAPKPIRMIFFIVLFGLFSTLIMNGIFGMNYVCDSEGNLYKGDIPSVLLYEGLVGYDEVSIYSPETAITSSGTIESTNLITKSPSTIGVTDDWWFLVPIDDSEFVQIEMNNILKKPTELFGLKTNKANFYVCYDSRYETCLMTSISTLCPHPTRPYFVVRYFWNEDRTVPSVEVDKPYSADAVDFVYFKLSDLKFNKCKKNDDVIDDPFNNYHPGAVKINKVDDNGFDEGWLYDADYLATRYSSIRSGGSISYRAGAYSEAQEEKNLKYTSDLVLEKNFELVPKTKDASKEFISRACISSAGDYSYKEDIVVYGIPVFKPEVIWIIVFLVIMLSMIRFFKK